MLESPAPEDVSKVEQEDVPFERHAAEHSLLLDDDFPAHLDEGRIVDLAQRVDHDFVLDAVVLERVPVEVPELGGAVDKRVVVAGEVRVAVTLEAGPDVPSLRQREPDPIRCVLVTDDVHIGIRSLQVAMFP